MNEVIRKRIRFFGSVQGVGFRYRAKHAAASVGATGWVRNEYDGSVSMEIQGTESQIDQVMFFSNLNVEHVSKAYYDFYAQVSDGSVTIDGDIEEAVAKVVTEVTFDFSNTGIRAGAPYTIEEFTGGRSDNDKLITDKDGNVVAPGFTPSNNKATYYYKSYNSATKEYGSVTSVDNGNPPSGQVGITVYRGDYSITMPRTSKFYTFSSNMLCFSGTAQYFVVNCPAGYTIKKVRLQCLADKTCTWGIGTTYNGFEISTATDYKGDGSADVDVEIPITSLNAGQKCYIASSVANNRLSAIVVTYEN